MDNKTYYVVTIQHRDGHMIDGCFMADDWKVVRAFSQKVYPHKVKTSLHTGRYTAAQFIGRYFKLFKLIDPLNYDHNLTD